MFGRKNEEGRLDSYLLSEQMQLGERWNHTGARFSCLGFLKNTPFHAFSHHDALKNYHILLLLILFGYQVVILNEKDAGVPCILSTFRKFSASKH
ncbi:hypothetical protein AR441_16725 [Bacillus velezensis]|nr:hypothetical protein AR441_16725 [Bacillus velezensis]